MRLESLPELGSVRPVEPAKPGRREKLLGRCREVYRRFGAEYVDYGRVGVDVVLLSSKVPVERKIKNIPIGLTIPELERKRPTYEPAQLEVAAVESAVPNHPLGATDIYEFACGVQWEKPRGIIVYNYGEPQLTLPLQTEFTLAITATGIVLTGYLHGEEVPLRYPYQTEAMVVSKLAGGVERGLRKKLGVPDS